MTYKVGDIIFADDLIEINKGKPVTKLIVTNTGDRTIQVCSHYHFFEVNKCLDFDRAKTYGFHLDIPSGTSVRFEPGEEKEVQLCAMGGSCVVYGLNDLTCDEISDASKAAALETARAKGFVK